MPQTSKDKGTRQAFIAFLSDSGLIFQPGPILGKKFWQQAEERNDLLTWKPVYVFLTSSGDLGYSTGAWEYRSKRTDTAAAGNGYFVSIWKKENNEWKVILDIGISFPLTEQKEKERFESAVANKTKTKASFDGKKELLNKEAAFIKEQTTNGYNAYSKFIANNARFYRPGSFPFIDDENKKKLFTETDKKFSYEMIDGAVSSAGDLGYVYGKAIIETIKGGITTTSTGNYLRIWKYINGIGWKIVLDLVNLSR